MLPCDAMWRSMSSTFESCDGMATCILEDAHAFSSSPLSRDRGDLRSKRELAGDQFKEKIWENHDHN